MRLRIIGASGHGKVAADIAVRCGYSDIAFLDDDEEMETCMGYPILGKTDIAERYSDSSFFIAIGDPTIRERVQEELTEKDLHIVSLIHPDAVVADHVSIGIGTIVMAGTVINPDSVIGKSCIINTGASIDHDNVIEDYVHISVGSHLAGTVKVGKKTWIGAGVIVSNNINICGGCMIGTGAAVVKDIKMAGTYVGVPAEILNSKRIENMNGSNFYHRNSRWNRVVEKYWNKWMGGFFIGRGGKSL